MYDATANAWCSLPVMNKARSAHGVVSVDDSHLYAFGGVGLTCVERLDVGAIVDGESSVLWSMCPGNMLNPSCAWSVSLWPLEYQWKWCEQGRHLRILRRWMGRW